MTRKRGNNEGTIVKLPSGSFRAQVTIDGKRLGHTGKTRSECQTWLRKMLDEIDNGMTYPASQITVGDFLTNWLETVKLALRPKPAHQYEALVRNHIIPVLGKTKLKDLRPEMVDGFYQNRLKAGVGVRTVRYIHSVLHVALEKAGKLGLLTRNPADGATLPRQSPAEIIILDESQVIQFLIASRENRNEALFHLAVKTGMRQAELLGLKWVDLNWTTGMLQVRRQAQVEPGKGFIFCEPKTKSGRRVIQLGGASLHVLRQQLQKLELIKQIAGDRWKENDLIFPSSVGTPINLCNLRKEFKCVLEKAGLPDIRFHDLRHTAASIMLKHNIPVFTVSRVLGHSRPSITLDIYAHMIPGMQDEVARLMDEVITPIPVEVEQKVKKKVMRELQGERDV